MNRLNEEERAETAKRYAREWTEYCKATDSMAFASATGDFILVGWQRLDFQIFNLLHVRVLEEGIRVGRKSRG